MQFLFFRDFLGTYQQTHSLICILQISRFFDAAFAVIWGKVMTPVMNDNNTMTFFIPHPPRAKAPFHVPESHTLHVCPPACARRHSLGSIKHGTADYTSCLNLSESDVALGDYELIIADAIEDLLNVLDPQPRAFNIYVNCIDDFLGTDEEALLAGLRSRFPDKYFSICHRNPIGITEDICTMPRLKIMASHYALLERSEKKENSVNLIGNIAELRHGSELFTVLEKWGVEKINCPEDMKTFDDFQSMAAARLNIILSPMERYSAEQMEKKLGIQWFDMPVLYSVNEVEKEYASLAEILHGEKSFCDDKKTTALEVVEKCRREVKDMPILVDSSAMGLPFSAARALLEYGFNVRQVLLMPEFRIEFDSEDKKWIKENHPEVKIERFNGYNEEEVEYLKKDYLMIGYDVAFSVRAEHVAKIIRDEVPSGYEGICTLMEKMIAASKEVHQWKRGINQ